MTAGEMTDDSVTDSKLDVSRAELCSALAALNL